MPTSAWIEWAVARRPMQGEQVSGDGSLTVVGADEALLGALDGLGHGTAAEAATTMARHGKDHDDVLVLVARFLGARV